MYKILLLPGDGIGTEIMDEARKVLSKIESKFNISIQYDEDLIGGCSIDKYGEPLTDAVLQKALDSDAVLLGGVGGPKWDNNDVRPEVGLLKIRKGMNLFANLRPIFTFDELIESSPLKSELVRGLDIMIVRELTGGLYFGEPKITEVVNGIKRSCDSMVYDENEIERISNVAFDIAKKRGNNICSVDKANILETSRLWRKKIQSMRDTDHQEIELSHMYVDNAAMQLVKNPKQFDVIVTENMFGDILSDCASQLTGSIGMLPSASLNLSGGKSDALYEPVHGTAPDIAGKGLANPIAMVMCIEMMFRYSFSRSDVADAVLNAVKSALKDGLRTADITSSGHISTSQMGDAIVQFL